MDDLRFSESVRLDGGNRGSVLLDQRPTTSLQTFTDGIPKSSPRRFFRIESLAYLIAHTKLWWSWNPVGLRPKERLCKHDAAYGWVISGLNRHIPNTCDPRAKLSQRLYAVCFSERFPSHVDRHL